MKRYTFVVTSVAGLLGAITGRGDGVLPAHSNFERYAAMVDRSPFAVATAVALPAATPDFAKDLYVANAARLAGGDMITLASSADQNFKKYLTTGQVVDGFTISNIEWSDRVGATRVTISKGGNFATLSFNQALASQRAAPKGPPIPGPVPQNTPPPQKVSSAQAPSAPQPPPTGVVARKPGSRANIPEVDPQRAREQREEQRRKDKARSKRPAVHPPTAESGQDDANVRP